MKIATWNVNSLKVRLSQVLDWAQEHRPDVVALQETKVPDERFPAEAIARAGYSAVYAGQKTYNGVAILSRAPATEVAHDIPGLPDPDRRILAATVAGVRVLNLYVVNGREVGSEKYAYKLQWLEAVREFVRAELERFERLVVLGDFNIAPEDRDVHDPQAWHEKILCSTPERDALSRLLDAGLRDTFRLFEQEAESFTWWDYRAASFRRNLGLRIDLILANCEMARLCTASTIDTAPRRLPRPSDHTPVVATFATG